MTRQATRTWGRSRAVAVLVVVGACLLGVARGAGAQGEDGKVGEMRLSEALVIERVSTGGRTLIQTDAVEALRVTGKWAAPRAGDEVTLGNGNTRAWETKTAADDGWLRVAPGGYAFWSVESAEEKVMILEASGHTAAVVNGEPRTGDPYEFGYVKLPVLLKKGANEILLKSGRGRVRAALTVPPADVFFNTADLTMPDLLVGGGGSLGGIIVVNATTKAIAGGRVTGLAGGGSATRDLPAIPALSARKVRVDIPPARAGEPGETTCVVKIELAGGAGVRVGEPASFKLMIRRPTDKHKRTFVSDIDGSVQYYSVVPPPEGTDLSQPRAVILSLHGASVEATNQANCYKQREWCYVICPTNRRPYGFDWEDWGRTDALEVLAEARKQFKLDDRRTYLTGHSMGGHGTWNIGVQFPGTFAAIGPSAGWISFWSYAGGANRENVSEVEKILLRGACTSDTLAMKQNFTQQGIYILHGDVDDNVPVAQARTMREELGKFHPDFAYHERPGANHWWGDQCVDWDPMIEFFKRHERPKSADIRHVEFTAVTPARLEWVIIEQQARQFEVSRVEADLDMEGRTFKVKTENVSLLTLEIERPGLEPAPLSVEIDGEKLNDIPWPEAKGESVLALGRGEQGWRIASTTRAEREKSGVRSGLFKHAFDGKMLLVYSTKGTPEENAWSQQRARYDAEGFWYRGNGAVDVVADVDLDDRFMTPVPGELPGAPASRARQHRNVILYGNADTNAAWKDVLADSPVRVSRGSVRVGEKELSGDGFATIFLRPREHDARAYVGVVGGSGLEGMRLTDRLPYFVSGVGVPDWVVFSPELLTKGVAGVKGAGFFGNDWSVERGEAVWQE